LPRVGRGAHHTALGIGTNNKECYMPTTQQERVNALTDKLKAGTITNTEKGELRALSGRPQRLSASKRTRRWNVAPNVRVKKRVAAACTTRPLKAPNPTSWRNGLPAETKEIRRDTARTT
jgi:hypothetical protein